MEWNDVVWRRGASGRFVIKSEGRDKKYDRREESGKKEKAASLAPSLSFLTLFGKLGVEPIDLLQILGLIALM